MHCRFHVACEFQLRDRAGVGLICFLHSGGVPAWKRLVDSLTFEERISLVMDIFSDRHETEVANRLCGEDAQSFVDAVYEVLDTLAPRFQSKCLGVLRSICDHQALLPRSITIPLCCDLSDTPLDPGACVPAWKGRHQGSHVVVKVLRPIPYSTGDFEMVTSVGFHNLSRAVFCQLMLTTAAVLQGGCNLERSSPSECATPGGSDD